MRRSSPFSTAALAAALALGCDDAQSPTAPAANPPAPSFRAEHGTTPFFFSLVDERYTVAVGLTFEDIIAICEETPFDVPTGDQLTATRPEGQDNFEESFKQLTRAKDLPLTVFESTGPACDLLAVPHYEGTGQAFIEDNDLLLTHNGANSFNIRVTGTVSDEGGQEYHVVGRFHQVVSSESTLENPIFLNSFVDIKLTPIGR
jgi:hypothetical protein